MSLPTVTSTQLPKNRSAEGKSMAQVLGSQAPDPQPQPVLSTQNEMRMKAVNNSETVASLLAHRAPRGDTPRSEPVELTPTLRSRKVPGGSDNVGRLLDVEGRLQDQERFNSFIMEQFNGLETKFQKLLARGVMDGPGRRSDDGELRIALLEEQLKKSERTVGQLQAYVHSMASGHTELGSMVSGLQRQEDSELTQIRALIQEKITTESKETIKNKEKAQALFGELVRLGEQQERNSDVLQRIGSVFEQRIQSLEGRLMQGEQVYTQLNQRTDSGVNILAEMAEKVERRMQMLEGALSALNVTFNAGGTA